MPKLSPVRVVPLLRQAAEGSAKRSYRPLPEYLRNLLINEIENKRIEAGMMPRKWRNAASSTIPPLTVTDALHTRIEQRIAELDVTWSEYMKLVLEHGTGILSSPRVNRKPRTTSGEPDLESIGE